jgi:peptidoglycan/xylan/chitin deacetylase (PgdA/CDA1 family)
MGKKLKQSLKTALFFSVFYSGILHLFIYILKKFKRHHCAAILFYHRFSRVSPERYQLPHLDINEFKKQMEHIKKCYTVLTMDDLAGKLANAKRFASPSVAVTIDDGYLSSYRIAYPILKELSLPATIYLTTGFVGTKKAPWVDVLMDTLFRTKVKTLYLPELLGKEVVDLSTSHQKTVVFSRLFKILLNLHHEKKITAMNRLVKILLADKTSSDNTGRKMVNWKEVIEMSENNIYFGAHTVTHPTLSKMEPPEAKREINDSQKEIEKRLGNKVTHFAIPNGKNEDFSDGLKKYCKDTGIKTVVSTEPGVVFPHSDPYFLKRIIPPPPVYVFACELARHMFLRDKRQSSETINDKASHE